jgi:hypothetical protein
MRQWLNKKGGLSMKHFSLARGFVVTVSFIAACESSSQAPTQEAKKENTPVQEAKQESAPVPTPSQTAAPAPQPTAPRKPPKETPEEARKQLQTLGLQYDEKTFFQTATGGNAAAVEHFIAAGMDPNVKDGDKWTPLMHAAEKGHTAVIQALLDGGADANAKDSENNTALTWAANEGHVDAAKALIAGGAEVNIKNKSGTTPLTRAVLYKRDAVAEVLRQAGATDPRRE